MKRDERLGPYPHTDCPACGNSRDQFDPTRESEYCSFSCELEGRIRMAVEDELEAMPEKRGEMSPTVFRFAFANVENALANEWCKKWRVQG